MPEVRKGWRRVSRWTLIVVGITCAAGSLVVARTIVCAIAHQTFGYTISNFDSAEWKSDWACGCTPPRMGMAHDLERNVDMRGWSREQVVDLLGTPDRHAYIQKYEQPGDFVYYLAPSFMDNYWFVVRFDTAGRVREAKVVED